MPELSSTQWSDCHFVIWFKSPSPFSCWAWRETFSNMVQVLLSSPQEVPDMLHNSGPPFLPSEETVAGMRMVSVIPSVDCQLDPL